MDYYQGLKQIPPNNITRKNLSGNLLGYFDVNGIYQVITPNTPLPVSGGGGTNGSAAGNTSTSTGFTNASGNQTPVSPSNPFPDQPYLVYNSTPPTVASGGLVPFQSDSKGNAVVTLGTAIAGEDLPNNLLGEARKYVITASTVYTRQTFVAAGSVTGQIKSSAGQIASVIASNSGTLAYFQIWDGPVNTGTLKLSVPIAAGTSTAPTPLFVDDSYFGPNGVNCATSITYGFSTAASTYTAGTAANYTLNATVI